MSSGFFYSLNVAIERRAGGRRSVLNGLLALNTLIFLERRSAGNATCSCHSLHDSILSCHTAAASGDGTSAKSSYAPSCCRPSDRTSGSAEC